MPDLVSVNTLLADDLRTRAVEVLRFAPTAASDALKLLIGLERDLVTKLAAVGLSADEPTVYQRARLDALLRQVRATIASTYSTIDRTTTDLLVELADAQTNWAAGSLNQNLGVSIATSNFSPQQLRAIVSSALIEGAPSKSWWSRQAGDVLHRFEAAMRTGLVSGETNAQLIQRVRGTRKNRFSDGIMAVPRRNAEALVRTSVMAVSNQAHLETWQANADVVGALMHVSTLDSRTTLVCIARSGMRWKVTGEPLGDALPFNPPPIHWNCRSVLVPVAKAFRELGLDVDEVPAGTRASIDGQVPADLSFNDWLRGKSEAFQDELLGPGRAALWRKGQISLTDLVDQRDRPLTIEQLKELGGKPKPPKPPPVELPAGVTNDWRGPPPTDVVLAARGRDEGGDSAWLKSLSTKERKAIERYTGHEYRQTNASLRAGADAATVPLAPTMDSAFAKAAQPARMRVYRYFGDDFDLSQFEVGQVVEDKAFVSTSLTPTGWNETQEIAEIILPKGARSGYIGDVSLHIHEYELLVARSARFRILGRSKGGANGQRSIVHMELLPHE